MERDFDDNEIAERVGFEPTVPLRIHYLSRVANSTTLASLHYFKYTESRFFFQRPMKNFKLPNTAFRGLDDPETRFLQNVAKAI
jgi:hypothetical protein